MTTLEKLAIEVSAKLKWDGDDICTVFLEALTDANFHSLRDKLEAVIEEDAKEDEDIFKSIANQVA